MYLDRVSILALPQDPGTYRIRNIRNGWEYVGSAGKQGIRRRLRTHLHDLERRKHHSWSLQRDWEKHAPEDFRVSALQILPLKDIRKAEQVLLDSRNTIKSYNVMDSASRAHLPVGMKENIREALRSQDTTWSHNTSGYRGVCFSKRQSELGSKDVWKASIHRGGKSYHVGYYPTPEKAHGMYKKAFSLPDSEFVEWFEELKNQRGNGQRGEKKGKSKLSNSQVRKLKEMYASGKYTQGTLAKRFGVHQSHICYIVSGKHRAHG